MNSKFISKVIVSTDDEEIAKISKEYGAEVPFLRDKNADHHSPISLATIRTLQQLQEINYVLPDIVVQLMANCPLRTAEDIDHAINNFIEEKINFQISSFKYGWMNPWWAHEIDRNGIARPIFKEEERMKRSQDLPDLYCPTGAIWIARTKKLFKSKTFYGPRYSFFPLHWIHAIDIDEYDDLEMASFFLSRR
nr:acylneuraminate cytidylyltransferase family protein [Salinimicrobium tongyeongense]